MNGILAVNKPAGISSYEVIRKFKKESGFQGKVGHAGTLDPFADGLLLVLLNKATKKFEEIQKWQKVYWAKAIMGASSRTLDSEGEIKPQTNCPTPKLEKIEFEARSLVGGYEQKVPDYSAAKHHGIPLYKLAREGKAVPPRTKWVEIYHISVTSYRFPELEFEADVGSGTYIRQLSYDWLKKMGVESYLVRLTRTSIGKIGLNQACKIDDFKNENWKKFILEV